MEEGKMMLHQETFPAQIPWRALLPRDLDNLVVPVCLSSTHVAWGAIRLEPTWMQIAESAAWAVVLAKRDNIPPARLDPEKLLRTVANARIMTTFLNDIDVADRNAPWTPAIQYHGAKGFFPGFDARPGEPLTEDVAKIWVQITSICTRHDFLPDKAARQVAEAEQNASPAISRGEFARLANTSGLQPVFDAGADSEGHTILTRAEACLALYRATRIHNPSRNAVFASSASL
jgi:hypothetical protein